MVSNPIGLIKNPGQDVYFSEEEDMAVAPKPKRISANRKNVNSSGQVKLDEYSDQWPQCCEEDYRSYALSKPQPYLTTKESAGVMYARSCFHQHLLQNQVLLCVLVYPSANSDEVDTSKSPQDFYQLFGFTMPQSVHFPKTGGWYPEKAITRNANLKWTNCSGPPAQSNIQESMTVMINSQAYKLDEDITKDFLREKTDDLVMMGSGGAATLDRSFGVDLPGCINAEEISWVSFPKPQYLNKINSILDLAALGS